MNLSPKWAQPPMHCICCDTDLSVLHHLMSHRYMPVKVRSKEIILQDGRTSIHVGTL